MYRGNMARKSRSMAGAGVSSCGTTVGDDGRIRGGESVRREVCEICGDLYAVTAGDEEIGGLCPACRRKAVRICPYCERPYRTDAWPHDLCPECYEEQEWRQGAEGDEFEDNFDRLDDY
jgi:hypothetical protein